MKEERKKLPENEKQEESGEVTRRDFLVGAGTVVVGGAIGAGLLSSCSNGEPQTVTTTKTVEKTTTIGGSGAVTVTETVGGEGAQTITETKTVTAPGGDVVEPWQESEDTIVRGFGFLSCDASCVDTKNGKVVRIRPLHYNWNYSEEEVAESTWEFTAKGKTYKCKGKSLPNYFSFAYKKRVYTPNRIMYPLQRVDFDPDADPTTGRNTQNRGKSKFKRITWYEATTMIANEIKRVQETYGPFSVFLIRYGWHVEEKVVHTVVVVLTVFP